MACTGPGQVTGKPGPGIHDPFMIPPRILHDSFATALLRRSILGVHSGRLLRQSRKSPREGDTMKRFVIALVLVGVLTLSLAGTALAGGPVAGDGSHYAPYGHGPGTGMYNPDACPHDNAPVHPRPQCETPECGDRWAEAYDGSPCGHCVSGDSYGCVVWQWDGCEGVRPQANYKDGGCGQPQAGCVHGYVPSQDGRTVGWANNGCSTDCWSADGWYDADGWYAGEWTTNMFMRVYGRLVDRWRVYGWLVDRWRVHRWLVDRWRVHRWLVDRWWVYRSVVWR